MSMPFFSLEADTLGGLRVSGAISFANAARALEQMPRPVHGAEAMAIDLGALQGADSATLAVFIAWSAAAHRAGTSLCYLRAPQGLRNLAKLCEVDGLLGLG
ncbi:MAG: STAS domain-containing protein [Proteobacteria bacterium]|nr:STAS domain-containing protein [Pseudomonadota bacterium]